MNYTLKNGTKLEGTLDQILKICKSMGETVDLKQIDCKEAPKGYYLSEKQGLIRIVDMNAQHIRNALLKLSKKYFEDLGKKTTLSNAEFMRGYIGLAEQSKVGELYEELSKR